MVYCDVIEILPYNIGQTREALIKWARAFGERFCCKTRFEKRRIAAKDPQKAADHLFRVSPKIKKEGNPC